MKRGRRKDSHLFTALREQLSRNGPEDLRRKAQELYAALFRQQLWFVKDPSKRKSLCTPRRVGKTYSAGTDLLGPALENPWQNNLYLTLTRETGRKLLWGWLKERDAALDLGIHFHNTFLEARLPNGSLITIAGASSRDEIDKLRGQAYDRVIIDEAQAFPHGVLDELIKEVIAPALLDRKGVLSLTGTPGPILAGEFYRATNTYRKEVVPYKPGNCVEEGWSFHTWTLKDNVAVPGLWEEALKEKARNGWTDQTPKWRREFLGEWVSERSQFVYLYDNAGDGRNDWTPLPGTYRGLPEGHQWLFVLGIDLGYTADTSFQVAAFSATHPFLYFIEEYNAPKMLVDDIARKILEFERDYGSFEAIVADKGNLATTLIEEIQTRFGIAVVAAEKREKRDHIELFNADLVSGRIKVSSACSVLKHQLKTVQWDRTLEKEDKRFANHAADAALYVWRYCRHHYWQEEPVELVEGSAAWERKMIREKIREATERRRKARGEEWWEPLAVGMDPQFRYSALDALFSDDGDGGTSW